MWRRRAIARMTVAAAVLAVGVPVALGATSSLPNAAYTTQGAWSFASAPNLHPPKLHTDTPTATKRLSKGYFFLGAFKNIELPQRMMGQGGPLLVDSRMRPVWFMPDCITGCDSRDIWTQDLGEGTYQGKPVLTYWEGAISPFGVTLSGKDFVLNEHYRVVATVKAAPGWTIDSHDLVIKGNNAWVSVTKNVGPLNLTAYGGSSHGSVVDTAIQEYNLQTGALLYTWDPLVVGHIPLGDSYTRPAPNGAPWDAYHLNSIQVGNGTFLAGFRNTWSGYQVNVLTGQIEWTLGGKHSTFTLGKGAAFSWQHNILLHPNGIVTLFDDACCGIMGAKNGVPQFAPPNGPARGLILRLNTSKHTAALVAQYVRGKFFYVQFTGSMQQLPGGNVVVGWGSKPFFTEYSKGAKVLLDAAWPSTDLTYRAILIQNWVGTPFYRPSGALRKTTVFASWNGATEVASWQVLAGSGAKHLAGVASAPKGGFENAFRLKQGYRAYRVRALDARGHVLGTSAVFYGHATHHRHASHHHAAAFTG